MAPNRRHPGKVIVGAYVPQQLKDRVLERAAAEGLSQTEAVTQALEEWLRKPPSAGV